MSCSPKILCYGDYIEWRNDNVNNPDDINNWI